jgi:hypothetical protein
MAAPNRSPHDGDLEWIEKVERRLSALERRAPRVLRFEADDGAYAELRVFPDGRVGLRVYTSAGALAHDLTAT